MTKILETIILILVVSGAFFIILGETKNITVAILFTVLGGSLILQLILYISGWINKSMNAKHFIKRRMEDIVILNESIPEYNFSRQYYATMSWLFLPHALDQVKIGLESMLGRKLHYSEVLDNFLIILTETAKEVHLPDNTKDENLRAVSKRISNIFNMNEQDYYEGIVAWERFREEKLRESS